MCTCKAAPSVCTVHSAFAARWAEFDAREDVAKREWEEDNANARTRKALLAAEERIDHLEYENKTREEEREEAIEKAADLANLLDQEREEHGAWVKAACAYLTKEQIEACNRAASGKPSKKKRGAA